ncbi:tetratricopeptide repeat protein [Tautonia plasticadhaerens]|uniref:Tetratricopeptide repeat protein n=1 Tax=Tautonia plasticadhaerens TaxID=2527974 RepID=A0A518GY53_9BACT|nr:tetratricopeptide repeat protein [Tautonia plasticadhaerens]QDV33505.1 Tetratricopeptide repeat protein [Tautonia plasticadhaerens]
MPSPNELYDQAIDLRDAGDKEAAVSKLKEAVEADPEHTLSHGLLARLCVDLGQFDDAMMHARRVAELEPEDPFSYTALSVIYQRCGRIPEAEDAMARARMKQMGIE